MMMMMMMMTLDIEANVDLVGLINVIIDDISLLYDIIVAPGCSSCYHHRGSLIKLL